MKPTHYSASATPLGLYSALGVAIGENAATDEDRKDAVHELRAFREWLANTDVDDGLTSEPESAFRARVEAGVRAWIRETRPNGARFLWARSSAWYVIAAAPVVGLLPRVWFGAAGSDGPRLVAEAAIDYEARQVGLPSVLDEDLAWLRGAT